MATLALYNTPLNYFIPGALRPANEELWYLKKDLVYLEKDFSNITCPGLFYSRDNGYLGSTGKCGLWKKNACTFFN